MPHPKEIGLHEDSQRGSWMMMKMMMLWDGRTMQCNGDRSMDFHREILSDHVHARRERVRTEQRSGVLGGRPDFSSMPSSGGFPT